MNPGARGKSCGFEPQLFWEKLLKACALARCDKSWVIHPATDLERWIEVSHKVWRPRRQGWKLHVSAAVDSSVEVLERSLRILMAEPTAFKLAATPFDLYQLNRGDAGPSQVGKFLTIYPSDDEQAVRLASQLDVATFGLVGPRVPSDRPLRPDSCVHYRYGAFVAVYMQTPLGQIVPSIEMPQGQLVPDFRRLAFSRPPWTVDPFEATGLLVRRPPTRLMVQERYLPVALLHSNWRASVKVALDTLTGQTCVLKKARGRSALEGELLPGERLRREEAVLATLRGVPGIPKVHNWIEEGGDFLLVLDYFPGPTIEKRVNDLAREGRFVGIPEIVQWSDGIAAIIQDLHRRDFVYNDLKPSNVILTDDGVRLVDFESAIPIGSEDSPETVPGTPGFLSPQRSSGMPPSVADDIYSFGVLLYFLVCAVNIADLPNPRHPLERPIELFNARIDLALSRLIRRCTAEDPSDRPSSMAEIRQALGEVTGRGLKQTAAEAHGNPCRTRGLALQLFLRLCEEAVRDARGYLCWPAARDDEGPPIRDLGGGAAGILLSLAEAATLFDEPVIRDTLSDGADWLAQAPSFPGGPYAGLLVGEAGISLALLHASRVLNRGRLEDAALSRATVVAQLPYTSPDIFHGTAGRLRFHLALWNLTAAREHLACAEEAGEHLLDTAELDDEGGIRWRLPHGFGEGSGLTYLGYAHGVAGIADCLLDLYRSNGDSRAATMARRAAAWLRQTAHPALDDGSGLDWAVSDAGRDRVGGLWCHGAAGVGQFLLNAGLSGILDDGLELACRAGRTVALGTRWAGPSQCHGLAGNIEFLVDLHLATGEREYWQAARDFAELVEPFAAAALRGFVGTPGTEESTAASYLRPDYLTGYSGIAIALLRTEYPDYRPHKLARKALTPDPRELNDLKNSRTGGSVLQS